MQTAVEFFFKELKLWYGSTEKLDLLYEQAKEMEKQMVIDIVEKSRATGLTAEYLLLTYGSKGSDDQVPDVRKMVEKDINYWKQNCEEEIMTTPISVLRYISELEKLVPTSSQTEISDEEIHKQADYYSSQFDFAEDSSAYVDFIEGIKWYREQLKKKI